MACPADFQVGDLVAFWFRTGGVDRIVRAAVRRPWRPGDAPGRIYVRADDGDYDVWVADVWRV